MKALSLVILAILSTACGNHHYWQVTCDSGFKTPISIYTSIRDGVIVWEEKLGDGLGRRKMIDGEACYDKRLHER